MIEKVGKEKMEDLDMLVIILISVNSESMERIQKNNKRRLVWTECLDRREIFEDRNVGQSSKIWESLRLRSWSTGIHGTVLYK